MSVIDEEAQAQKDFDEGMATEIVKPKVEIRTEAPAVIPAAEKPAAKPAAEAKPAKPAAPKFVQITDEQYRRFEEAATKTGTLETQLSKVFGTVGDVQQIVKKLQAATPAGLTVELPANVVSEMERDFPELAALFKTSLEKALKGIKGTAPSAAALASAVAAAPDAAAIERLIADGVNAASIKYELEALEESYANWREIVGAVDAQGRHDPNNEFRKWLATQDMAYQHKINSTNSSKSISTAIGKFLASKAAAARTAATPANGKPAPKVIARRAAIAAAITPRGDGGQPSPGKTADDEFNEGFRAG